MLTTEAQDLIDRLLARPSRSQARLLAAGWTPRVVVGDNACVLLVRWSHPDYTTEGMTYSLTQVDLIVEWETALAEAYHEAGPTGKPPAGTPQLHAEHALKGLVFIRNAAPPGRRYRGRWVTMRQQEQNPSPTVLGMALPAAEVQRGPR